MALIKNNNIPKFADGGMSMSMAEPWFERRNASEGVQAYHPGGLYNGATGGRTDNITNLVPAGAYVIPADVVSGLGEGTTHAGAAILDKMFHTNPHGIQGSHISGGHGVGMPSPPHKFSENTEFAKGGAAKDTVPIITASGEYLVNNQALIDKFGSLKRAHKVMDAFVKHIRKKTIEEMSKLKGPKV